MNKQHRLKVNSRETKSFSYDRKIFDFFNNSIPMDSFAIRKVNKSNNNFATGEGT